MSDHLSADRRTWRGRDGGRSTRLRQPAALEDVANAHSGATPEGEVVTAVPATAAPAASRRSALWAAARDDWRTTPVSGRMLLVLALGVLTYEWSSGNESFSSLLATYCLHGRMSVGGVLFAGAVVGAAVALQQIVSGALLLSATRNLPRLFAVLTTIVQKRFKGPVPTYRSLPVIARIPISFFMGASFVVTQDAVAGERSRRRSVLLSAATTGTTLFVMVGVFGGAVVAAAGTPLARPAQIVLDIVSDWRVWAAVIVGPAVLAGLLRRRRTARAAAAPAA